MTFYCCVCATKGNPQVEASFIVAGYAVCFNHIRAAAPSAYVVSTPGPAVAS